MELNKAPSFLQYKPHINDSSPANRIADLELCGQELSLVAAYENVIVAWKQLKNKDMVELVFVPVISKFSSQDRTADTQFSHCEIFIRSRGKQPMPAHAVPVVFDQIDEGYSKTINDGVTTEEFDNTLRFGYGFKSPWESQDMYVAAEISLIDRVTNYSDHISDRMDKFHKLLPGLEWLQTVPNEPIPAIATLDDMLFREVDVRLQDLLAVGMPTNLPGMTAENHAMAITLGTEQLVLDSIVKTSNKALKLGPLLTDKFKIEDVIYEPDGACMNLHKSILIPTSYARPDVPGVVAIDMYDKTWERCQFSLFIDKERRLGKAQPLAHTALPFRVSPKVEIELF